MALGGGAQQRGGNSLAHHVPDDHIQTLIRVFEKNVEIAVDPLGGDGQRGHSKSGNIPGRLIEQQSLLDSEADFDFALPGLCEFRRAACSRRISSSLRLFAA